MPSYSRGSTPAGSAATQSRGGAISSTQTAGNTATTNQQPYRPMRSSTDQSVVMAQCYYDFRHCVSNEKGSSSAPLPSVLRVPTTQTTTQTFKGSAASAVLARHGLHLDLHNRLVARTIFNTGSDGAVYSGISGEGIQQDGEERVIRHTKHTVTTRRTDPIPITGDHILTHALGSLFFSSWRAYRAAVFESHDGDYQQIPQSVKNSQGGGSDPLVDELTKRSNALEQQAPPNASATAEYRLKGRGGSLVTGPLGRNGAGRSFVPFVLPSVDGSSGSSGGASRMPSIPSSSSQFASPRDAAAHLATIVDRFERAHIEKRRRAIEARKSNAASAGPTAASRSRANNRADAVSYPHEKESIQTLLELIDACDVGVMAAAAAVATKQAAQFAAGAGRRQQQQGGGWAQHALDEGNGNAIITTMFKAEKGDKRRASGEDVGEKKSRKASRSFSSANAFLENDVLTRQLCPRFIFSDLLDPSFLPTRDADEGGVGEQSDQSSVPLMPNFLNELLLATEVKNCSPPTANGTCVTESTSPYAEVRILSEVVRRFEAITAAAAEVADSTKKSKSAEEEEDVHDDAFPAKAADKLTAERRRVDQLRRLHERQTRRLEEEKKARQAAAGGDANATANRRAIGGSSSSSSIVSLLSEPAIWYKLLDECVEAFVNQHQYGGSGFVGGLNNSTGNGSAAVVEGEEGLVSDDVREGDATAFSDTRAVVRAQHFSDPISHHHYLMRAKKTVLRALCLSLVTHFDTREGAEGMVKNNMGASRPLLPSRYTEDYTLFISKPDGTLLPSWEEFCEDCQVPLMLAEGDAMPAGIRQRQREEGEEGDAPIDGEEEGGGGGGGEEAFVTMSRADPLIAAYMEAVYHFDALNDTRLVKDYLAPRLMERVLTPEAFLALHPLAVRTHQYRQLSAMHPHLQAQRQLHEAMGVKVPTHTAMDYIPLTFTVCFTPKHPMTTGLHVAASSVKALLQSPTALFIDRSPLLWVPTSLIAQGGSLRLDHVGIGGGVGGTRHPMNTSHHASNGAHAPLAQTTIRDVAKVFEDLAAGVARLLLKAVCVSTLHDVTLAINAGGRRPPKTVVTSYLAMLPRRPATRDPSHGRTTDGEPSAGASHGGAAVDIFVSRNAKGKIFSFNVDFTTDDDASPTSPSRATASRQKTRIPPIVDASSAALALQLLSREDGHEGVRLRNTAGLLEDKMARQRGAHKLSFIPPLQLPFAFLNAMRRAELFDLSTFLLLSNGWVRGSEVTDGDADGVPYRVEWNPDAEDDALAVDAAASLYSANNANSLLMNPNGSNAGATADQQQQSESSATSPTALKQLWDARELLKCFTLPQLSEAQRTASDVVLLPTILVPERAGRGRAAADAFIGQMLDVRPTAMMRGGARGAATYGRGDGAFDPIVCGYGVAVSDALASGKALTTDMFLASPINPYLAPHASSLSSSSADGIDGGYSGHLSGLEVLAGTTSLSALCEEVGMSAYDIAMYGGARLGSLPLMPPTGVSSAGTKGNCHPSALTTAVGRVVALNAPLEAVLGTYAASTPNLPEGACPPPVPVSVLAKQASRACQILAPSFIAQELDRQRLENVRAVAASRRVAEESSLKRNTSKVAASVRAREAAAAAGGGGGKGEATDLNLADALIGAKDTDTNGSHQKRMHAGKRAFEHLVRAGIKRVNDEDAALDRASSHLVTVGGIGAKAFTGAPLVARSTATSLLDVEAIQRRGGGAEDSAFSFIGASDNASRQQLNATYSHIGQFNLKGNAKGGSSVVFHNVSDPNILTLKLDSCGGAVIPSATLSVFGDRLKQSAKDAPDNGSKASATTISRSNGAAMPSGSKIGILQTPSRPLTLEERMRRQEEQLARRLEAKALHRSLHSAHQGEVVGVGGSPIIPSPSPNKGAGDTTAVDTTDASIQILSDPRNTMSRYVMQNLRPELRRLTAGERQAKEERNLVGDLLDQCASERDAQTRGLCESKEARNRVRDVRAEVEDTMSIENALIARKRLGRQQERAHNESLAGGLQRLLVDSTLDAYNIQHRTHGEASALAPPPPHQQQDLVASVFPYNKSGSTFNVHPSASDASGANLMTSMHQMHRHHHDGGEGHGSTLATASAAANNNGNAAAPPLPSATNTFDNRTLGFEHLMSRDRSAAYM